MGFSHTPNVRVREKLLRKNEDLEFSYTSQN